MWEEDKKANSVMLLCSKEGGVDGRANDDFWVVELTALKDKP